MTSTTFAADTKKPSAALLSLFVSNLSGSAAYRGGKSVFKPDAGNSQLPSHVSSFFVLPGTVTAALV